jgi:hypothetical protein
LAGCCECGDERWGSGAKELAVAVTEVLSGNVDVYMNTERSKSKSTRIKKIY